MVSLLLLPIKLPFALSKLWARKNHQVVIMSTPDNYNRPLCSQITTALCVCSVAKVCPTPRYPRDCNAARQASLTMGFSRQECWSGLPFTPGESSQARDQTHASCVSCIGRWIHCATWETQL